MSDNESYLSDIISIRELQAQDVNFIVDSFISCLNKYQKSIVNGYSPQYSKQLLEKIILSALQNKNYSTFVCTNKDNENDIFGYIIGDSQRNHLFFSYTKYVYRKLGLQRLFLVPLVIDMEEKFTINWPTKEAKRITEKVDAEIQNKFFEDLL